MCEYGNTEEVIVKIPPDLSFSGAKRWKVCDIDACIAPIVQAFQNAGIDMRASCCGHGKRDGEIILEDGRKVIVKENGNEHNG